MLRCFILLVILFVGCYGYPASKNDGIVMKDDTSVFFDHTVTNGRIVGGSTATEGSYPWMVAITVGFMVDIFVCAGAIITNRHALTAGHCSDAILSANGGNSRVVVGTNRWKEPQRTYSLFIVAKNPNYDVVTKRNDIGIVGTRNNITFNDRVRPIPINYDFVPGGILVRVSGWGWQKTGGTLSDELQELRLMTLEGNSCVVEVRQVAQSLGMNLPRVEPNLQICTFLTGNEGICVGDGGSPLVRNSNNQLIGVASWGVLCARGAPDVFTRVSSQRTWIELVLAIPI